MYSAFVIFNASNKSTSVIVSVIARVRTPSRMHARDAGRPREVAYTSCVRTYTGPGCTGVERDFIRGETNTNRGYIAEYYDSREIKILRDANLSISFVFLQSEHSNTSLSSSTPLRFYKNLFTQFPTQSSSSINSIIVILSCIGFFE